MQYIRFLINSELNAVKTMTDVLSHKVVKKKMVVNGSSGISAGNMYLSLKNKMKPLFEIPNKLKSWVHIYI